MRLYLQRERKRRPVLTAVFEEYLRPAAGSGGANVKYLYDLSQAQQQAIERWLDAEAAGQSAALPDLMRQIAVNDGAMERAVLLFKLLLGREDHGLKGGIIVCRKDDG
jgi:hypothetical protein